MIELIKQPCFLMSVPLGLDASNANNIWMKDLSTAERKVDKTKAIGQWSQLYQFMAAQSIVYLLPTTLGLGDQVYVANLGVVLPDDLDTVILSNFKSPPRIDEAYEGKEFFKQMGYEIIQPKDKFEGQADFKWINHNVFVGAYGQRTDIHALHWFQTAFDLEVLPCFMEDEKLYHLDTVLFPITQSAVVISKDFTTSELRKELERHTEVILAGKEETLAGITNSIRCGQFVLGDSNINDLKKNDPEYAIQRKKITALEKICADQGLELRMFNISELYKSGANLSCCVQNLNYEQTD